MRDLDIALLTRMCVDEVHSKTALLAALKLLYAVIASPSGIPHRSQILPSHDSLQFADEIVLGKLERLARGFESIALSKPPHDDAELSDAAVRRKKEEKHMR